MEPEELEGPQETQEAAPQQPSMDPRTAMEIAAQHLGVGPDFLEGAVRLQDENRRVSEENRRRAREIEIREAQVEALGRERQAYLPKQPEYEIDPVIRPVYDRLASVEKMFMEERQERQRQAEHQKSAQRMAQDLESQYRNIMRGVPSQNQVDQDRFFSAMGEIYPTETGMLPPGITPEKAAFFTAKYLGLNPSGGGSGGYGQSRTTNGSTTPDRRASIVIPGGTTGGGPAIPASAGYDIGPQKPGETMEQALARQKSEFERATAGGLSMRNIPEGRRFSSG